MINLFKVRVSDFAIEKVSKVLKSGFIGQGLIVEEFEDALQKELKSSVRPITVNSCTSAIDLSLDLCGAKYGDEVISTPQTCFATQVGAIHRGCTIRWADIDPITGLISAESVSNLITDKTKCILAVNWGGKICDFEKIKSFGIPVIEDAAHCWGYVNGNIERGDYICYSFQAIKFLTCGDGGLLITPPEKEHQARILRWYGLDRTKSQSFRCTQNIIEAGYKYHMNDISAAIGLSNIEGAKKSVEQQKKNSKFIIDNVRNENLIIPEYDSNCSYWIFSMHVKSNKDHFIEYMKNLKIEASPVHFRNDNYDCTKKFEGNLLYGVNSFTKTQICVPNGWWLTEDNLNYIVDALNNYEI